MEINVEILQREFSSNRIKLAKSGNPMGIKEYCKYLGVSYWNIRKSIKDKTMSATNIKTLLDQGYDKRIIK